MKPLLDRCQVCFTRCSQKCRECVDGANFKPLGAGVCVKVVVPQFESNLDLIPDSYVKTVRR